MAHVPPIVMVKRILLTASKAWFFFIQFLTIPANYILTKLLRLTVIRPKNLRISHGTIIIANHQSRIDPFLISFHIGARNLLTTVPIRYPVTPEYMKRPVLGFFIRLLGGYNIGTSPFERLKKLVFTRKLLKDGYTIVLFPEGKITRDSDMVDDFKKGANMLFNESYPVVFVRLTGLNDKHRFHFWKKKQTMLVYSEYYNKAVSKEKKVEAMVQFFNIDSMNEKAPARGETQHIS